MPKTSKDFTATLNFGVDLDTKQHLTAIGYFTQAKGEYASPARNFLKRSIKDWYRNLSERDRKDFDEILANVRIQVVK